jgi:hypothetical protein
VDPAILVVWAAKNYGSPLWYVNVVLGRNELGCRFYRPAAPLQVVLGVEAAAPAQPELEGGHLPAVGGQVQQLQQVAGQGLQGAQLGAAAARVGPVVAQQQQQMVVRMKAALQERCCLSLMWSRGLRSPWVQMSWLA